ncbi:MAG: TIGR03663 family protein [Acidimicrobiia bacterium]|nr:TIGR03663 family protein [Acidimicrobiia bacterium]MYC57126.1 TIGR03663 family protein [Acidimicrobiia bacterium]MYG94772.1 TIGR03663 family protein [Acidimicrobiia bacterium]MYI30203.1 TIGR03663 family protein [Acidimicrobiia bacterium]
MVLQQTLSDMKRERQVPLASWHPAEFWRCRPNTALAIVIGAIALTGLVLRLLELAERPLHHDESLDAWYSWQFLEGIYEGYDPVYHGPLRFYLTAGFFWLFGESHTTARLLAVLAGVGLIILPWFLRRWLGSVPTVVASAVLAISPISLYMSRLGREDALMAFITLALMVAIARFVEQPHPLLLAVMGFLLAAGFAVKETMFIVLFIFGGFFLALLGEQAAQAKHQGQQSDANSLHVDSRFAGWAWMLPAGLLPMGIAFVVSGYYNIEVFLTLGIYGVLMVEAILLLASPRSIWDLPLIRSARQAAGWAWLVGVVVFLFFFALWFTVFFQHPEGFLDGFTKGITYWRGEQATNRGGESWHYYLYTVPLYEYLLCILAAIGVWRVFHKPTFLGKFMVWTTVASWFSYSWASERFPWLALHLVVPMAFLAGYGTEVLWQTARKVWGSNAWGTKAQRPTLWASVRVLPGVTSGVVMLALLASTVFFSWRVNYHNQRDPRELLTQVHTTHEYLDTVRHIEALQQHASATSSQPVTVAIDTALSVPNLWYFRKHPTLQWVDANSVEPLTADFVLHALESNLLTSEADLTAYETTRLPLRDWWAPQFDSYHQGWFSGWARWLLTREVWNEDTLGSSDFNLSLSPRALRLTAALAAG